MLVESLPHRGPRPPPPPPEARARKVVLSLESQPHRRPAPAIRARSSVRPKSPVTARTSRLWACTLPKPSTRRGPTYASMDIQPHQGNGSVAPRLDESCRDGRLPHAEAPVDPDDRSCIQHRQTTRPSPTATPARRGRARREVARRSAAGCHLRRFAARVLRGAQRWTRTLA